MESIKNRLWGRLLILASVFLLFTLSPATAQEQPDFFSVFKMSASDQEKLDGALMSAVMSLAPYRTETLAEDADLPAEVPAFFETAKELAEKYDVSGGKLLLLPQSLLIQSGKVSPEDAERAFAPLSDLLEEHNVRGDEILDLILPGILSRMEVRLKTPPEQRSELRQKPTGERKKQFMSFAREHRISLRDLIEAVQPLKSLQSN
jgi:hypothetical protein